MNDDPTPEVTATGKPPRGRRAADADAAQLPVIDFYAHDRYHAITHVRTMLAAMPGDVKERLVAALEGMEHRGMVQVVAPAPAPPPDDAPEDPTAPKDGAFIVKPVVPVAV
jgi:hypothetical protein